jgi:hypothetical protein
MSKKVDDNDIFSNYHQAINLSVISTQSTVNKQMNENLQKSKAKIKNLKLHNFMTKALDTYFQPSYSATLGLFFERWRSDVLQT